MIAHKEAFLRGDEGLANDLEGSTYIQGIGLMHAHPRMLIKTGVFARFFAGYHERSSFLLDVNSSVSCGMLPTAFLVSLGRFFSACHMTNGMTRDLSTSCSPIASGL